jgi:hypothetical protein
MSEGFTLDALRDAADKKYGSFRIEISPSKHTVLRSPMRISQAARTEVYRLIEEIAKVKGEDGEVDEESHEANEMAVRLVGEFFTAVGDRNTKALIDGIGDDLGLLLEVFSAYQSAVSLGEASPSES